MQDLSNQGIIKAGSVVELMSGGPKMTVRSDTQSSELALVECWWFNPQGMLCKEKFLASMLTYSM